jgi:hypothetical protein
MARVALVRVPQVLPLSAMPASQGVPFLTKGSRPYAAASRVCALALPASFISHMILAVAQRR